MLLRREVDDPGGAGNALVPGPTEPEGEAADRRLVESIFEWKALSKQVRERDDLPLASLPDRNLVVRLPEPNDRVVTGVAGSGLLGRAVPHDQHPGGAKSRNARLELLRSDPDRAPDHLRSRERSPVPLEKVEIVHHDDGVELLDELARDDLLVRRCTVPITSAVPMKVGQHLG